MLDKLHRPFVAHVIEEPPNVRVQHPVHSLPTDTHMQRIERVMRVASRTKPVRVTPKVHLINFIKDGDHGLLNDFVLQRRNAQWTLPSIALRNINST